jgi:RNA polymerase-interacting CarD/CdnL/TRCF family regulator
LLGTEYKFAILFFPREELQISLPAKKLDETVREPLNEAKARELLDEMSGMHESLSKSWKIRSRKNQERLSSGDPLQLYMVFRGLLELRSEKGSLNNSDRKQLTLSLDLLAEELSVALDKTPEQIKVILEKTTSLDAA